MIYNTIPVILYHKQNRDKYLCCRWYEQKPHNPQFDEEEYQQK